jgi:hypothetical protein
MTMLKKHTDQKFSFSIYVAIADNAESDEVCCPMLRPKLYTCSNPNLQARNHVQ